MNDILLHPFSLGFGLGLVFLILALYQFFRLKGELTRFKRHLSDKLEIEADLLKKMKNEQESLRKENEHLRVKVSGLNDLPDRKVQRDLEVYARAEKRMLVSVPGFAPAWENAKSAAISELEDEEAGKSIPKKVFARFFGSGRKEESVGSEKVLLEAPAAAEARSGNSDG